MTSHAKRPRWARAVASLGLAAVLVGSGVPAWAGVDAGVATATTAAKVRVDLRVLVLDDGQAMVRAIVAQLDREGVPYTRVDLNAPGRTVLTRDALQVQDKDGLRAKYQAVVAPVHAPAALSPAELSALYSYEASFGIRQVSAYNWPDASVGLGAPVYSGSLDGSAATVSAEAKKSGFGHLTGSLTLDDFDPAVLESYGYVANAGAGLPAGTTYTPFLTVKAPGGATGSVMGVVKQDRREELVLTFAQNEFQQHSAVLGHGILEWMTRGVHLGEYRNYLSVQIDDVFMADNLWSVEGKCTIGDGCDPVAYPEDAVGATSRMVAADVEVAYTWQKSNQILLDMAYNSNGSVEYAAEHAKKDPLFDAFKKRSKDFRWLNHTKSHLNLSCTKDYTTDPWSCLKDAKGKVTYVDTNTIRSEIADNESWGDRNGFVTDNEELVTGEHSGLASLPQMPADNPNLAAALEKTNTRYVASDASREKDQRAASSKTLTVPRYPMNVYYNTATYAQAASEYNWMYTSRANGGSGMCEDLPGIMTCIAPLDLATGYVNYIAPQEVRTTFRHVATSDPRPHYAHQPNLTGDRLLYPVLNGVVQQYRATYDTTSAPLLNLRTKEIGEQMKLTAAWNAAKNDVTATLVGDTIEIKSAKKTVEVPVTAGPNTSKAELTGAYAGSRSEFEHVLAGLTEKVKLSTKDITYPVYQAVTVPAPVAPQVPIQANLAPTTIVPLVDADAATQPTEPTEP